MGVHVRAQSSNPSMDSSIDTLAILNGVPKFAEPLHVGRPNLGNRQTLLTRIDEMLERRWLTNDGPFVREFERRICELIDVQHCVTMCNATVALEIAIRALELRGEVIVPSYTFVATAHALQWQEITPVFADIHPQTYNIDPECIERLITPRTTGIIGVHVWGRPCDTDAIESIGHRHKLKVMYDAAHALACSRRGRVVGGFGACEVLSFHATKFLNSFEGGAIVTNDEALAQKVRLMRNFGFSGYDRVIYLGTNGKMAEVCAAMGVTSIESLDQIVATNRRNYERYCAGLRALAGLSLIEYDVSERNNYQYVVVDVDPAGCRLDRDELISVLHAENVLARKYFWPGCHRMQPYRALQPSAHLWLPETERISSRTMLLPTGQSVTAEAIDTICGVIRDAVSQSAAVKSALRQASCVSNA